MELKIGHRKIDLYNNVSVSLLYDSVASTFAFSFYFDPENADHRAMFRPAAYQSVTIEHGGELLITGTLLNTSFKSNPARSWVEIAGYSKTGVLEDCEIPTSAYPLQSNGLSLEQIARKCIKPFGLTLTVDPSVASKAGRAYAASTAKNSQTVKEYLSRLAGQRHIMLTHDEHGNLLLTQAKTTAAPVFDIVPGTLGVIEMELQFDGQRMHSGVTMIKQQTKGRADGTHKKGNAGQSAYSNPFVPVFRPRVNRQTSGAIVDTELAARNMLSEELMGCSLRIELDRWTMGGRLVRPNTMITVTDPDTYQYKKTKWFIAAVEFNGDHNAETATLTCVLPSVFGAEAPVNIFS